MKVGVVGTNWGRMHIGAFRAAGAEIVAVCGKSFAKTREIAREEDIPIPTTGLAELLAVVDVVVIASPDAAHFEHVMAAIEAGKPVLVEKPLAMNVAQARALAAAAKAARVPAAVCFPYRMIPEIAALESFIRARSPVLSLELVFRNGFISGPTSKSGDFGGISHVLDAALFLIEGSPVRVRASLDEADAQSSYVLVEFDSGARASIAHRPTVEPGTWGGWALRGADWEAGFGAGFRPASNGWTLERPRAFFDGEWRDLPVSRPEPDGREPWARAHVDIARAFLGVVNGRKWPRQLASLADGTCVQFIIDAARAEFGR